MSARVWNKTRTSVHMSAPVCNKTRTSVHVSARVCNKTRTSVHVSARVCNKTRTSVHVSGRIRNKTRTSVHVSGRVWNKTNTSGDFFYALVLPRGYSFNIKNRLGIVWGYALGCFYACCVCWASKSICMIGFVLFVANCLAIIKAFNLKKVFVAACKACLFYCEANYSTQKTDSQK